MVVKIGFEENLVRGFSKFKTLMKTARFYTYMYAKVTLLILRRSPVSLCNSDGIRREPNDHHLCGCYFKEIKVGLIITHQDRGSMAHIISSRPTAERAHHLFHFPKGFPAAFPFLMPK